MSLWLSSIVLLSSSLVRVLCLRVYCDSARSGKYDCNTWCCSLICCQTTTTRQLHQTVR